MNDTVIKVENLSKSYLIAHQSQEKYLALRDVIAGNAKTLGRRLMHPFKSSTGGLITADETEEFWALKDINFEVKRGDRVGIIGRNGAGKSTLLKILSRITEPTSGRIEIDGRVASLLEVGTGFHPELTGRENIFLNGAILGMSRLEIKRKFDEIVAFAEVEKFLDTPVKRYSSGMYVRLAFAVAAHLEPEILIVDEVLAVGDAQFQKKCLGKMEDVGKDGRTVIFVSHNMGVITALCNWGAVLSAGSLDYQGNIHAAVAVYNGFQQDGDLSVENCARRGGSGGIKISRVWATNALEQKVQHIVSSAELHLHLEAVVDEEYRDKRNIVIGFGIDNLEGKRLVTCVSSWISKEIPTCGKKLKIACRIPSIPLVSDKYLISASVSYNNETLDYVEHSALFEIESQDMSLSQGREAGHGFIDLPYDFEVANVP